MSNAAKKLDVQPENERELVISRIMDVPREKVFKAFADAKLLKQWYAPRPWSISHVEIDLRTGGTIEFTMKSPEGQEFPNSGVYLEVIPNEKIVSTDAYTAAWEPSEKPFFTAILTFEDIGGGKTKYTARARHWTAADRDAHAKMGFHEGWGQCAAQLEEVAKRI
jgi:uncharacterized protein YndB with AHSA1/START domain